MRHVKILGVMLVTMVALSGIASATALAEEPEFTPGAAGTKFTGTGGKGKLEVKGEAPVECEKTAASGEIVGATKKEASATVTFSECTAFFFFGAHTLKDAEGIIKVKAHLKLCIIKFGAPLEVGVLTKLDEPAHIEVAGKLLAVTGDQVAKITPVGKKTKTFELVYAQAGGVPKPAGCAKLNAKKESETENETYLTEINESGKLIPSGEEATVKAEFAVEQTLLG